MRLAPLLAELSAEEIARIGDEHLRTDEPLTHSQLCLHLENSIRSSRFLADFIINRQPPTFLLLNCLLEASGFEMAVAALRDRVLTETETIKSQLDAKELLERDNGLHVYRKMFFEARKSDNEINSSESSLLGVYRREMNISLVAHYLIEHHADFREFWVRNDSFDHAIAGLKRAGVVFEKDGKVVLPEDLVPGVMQAIGIDMTAEATKRLLEHVTAGDMVAVLEAQHIKTSGSRADREERVLRERIQAGVILGALGIGELRDICRKLDLTISGAKDEVIERIVGHLATGRDLVVEAPPPPPLKEPKRLDEHCFGLLFGALKNQELFEILRRRDLRQTGTKEQRVATLWASHISEVNLLGELMNRDLEDLLGRVGLRVAGSKPERIERLLTHFSGQGSGAGSVESPQPPAAQPSAAVQELQETFCRHSSAGQEQLQAWLGGLLQADGQVRCYATTVSNPSQQLKNKLSQAANAKLLVLSLADAEALARAEEALTERWATNDEWPKVASCVALAQPAAGGAIESFVERVPSELGRKLREQVFPNARLVSLPSTGGSCSACGGDLGATARFCPQCGTLVVRPATALVQQGDVGPKV